MRRLQLTVILLSILTLTTLAQKNDDIIINDWLKAGNIYLEYPVFNNIENIKGKKFEMKDLLKFHYLDVNDLHPVADSTLLRKEGQNFQWIKKHDRYNCHGKNW